MTAASVQSSDVLAALADCARRRAGADTARQAATDDLAVWLRAGRDRGVAITTMAEAAGVTRVTVYALLGER